MKSGHCTSLTLVYMTIRTQDTQCSQRLHPDNHGATSDDNMVHKCQHLDEARTSPYTYSENCRSLLSWIAAKERLVRSCTAKEAVMLRSISSTQQPESTFAASALLLMCERGRLV